MTLRSLLPAPRALLAVTVLLAVFGLGMSTPQVMAKTASQSKAAATDADPSKPENIEKRIADLHEALKITPAQEPVWGGLVKVMRENADKMKALMDKWAAQYDKMSAVDNLKSHLEMAEENTRAMRELIPAFEKLYASMADDQKKLADDVFAYRTQQGQKKSK